MRPLLFAASGECVTMMIVCPLVRLISRSRAMISAPVFTVQVSRRLVGKENFWIADQGAGNSYTLLLPARQFTGRMPPAVR